MRLLLHNPSSSQTFPHTHWPLTGLCSAAEAERRTPLHLAAALGEAAVVRQVVAARSLAAVCAKDVHGWLPLHSAAAAGHVDIAASLLAAGSEVDEPAGDGDTPLHKASLGGHLAVVQLLRQCSQVGTKGRCRGRCSGCCCRRSFTPALAPSTEVVNAATTQSHCHQCAAPPHHHHCRCCSWTSATWRGRPRCTMPPARATSR